MNETDNIPTPVTEQGQHDDQLREHDYHAEPMAEDQLREYFRKIGRIGGRTRSEAKRAAARENARKANQARWGKKAPGEDLKRENSLIPPVTPST